MAALLGIIRPSQIENTLLNQIMNNSGTANISRHNIFQVRLNLKLYSKNNLFNSDKLFKAREYDNPPGLLEKTELLLGNWINNYSPNKDCTKIFSSYIQQVSEMIKKKLFSF